MESVSTHNLPVGHGLIQTVLLLDAPQITEPVGQFLRQVGWTVHEASNCGQARALIARCKPDFLITELLLPLETGFEFCAFLKKADCRICVMIFTEVGLEEARNLAMWAGADAFVTKPTDPNFLYQQMLAAAQRASYRMRAVEMGLASSISFRCKCGRQLRVGSKHAGRAVICPGCRHLARCPESLLDAGTMFSAMMEERRGLRSTHSGIVCPNCRKTVDPRHCRVRDHYECQNCRHQLKIPADFMEQWLLFFSDQSQAGTVAEFSPLRYVFVQCETCHNLHQYFGDSDVPQPCSSCGHQHSLPSIRGVPVSRAALASTGRLFEFRFVEGRSKLFLLPLRRKWMIGSSAECVFALQNQPLAPRHCILRNTPEGPMLLPAAPDAKIAVNGQSVSGPMLLQPGDDIRLGGIQLLLHGTPEKLLRKKLSRILDEVADRRKLTGELELAEPAARILQYHWELQRLKWIDCLRSRGSNASGESSLIQQIDSRDLPSGEWQV